MKFIEYDNNSLIDFYIANGLEFDAYKDYFGSSVKSFVIEENKKILGAISISKYKGKNYIEAIAVDKDYRCKGYGKLLLDKTMKGLEKPVYTISKSDVFFLKNGFIYDNIDLIDKECKNCNKFNITCFPKVLVFK